MYSEFKSTSTVDKLNVDTTFVLRGAATHVDFLLARKMKIMRFTNDFVQCLTIPKSGEDFSVRLSVAIRLGKLRRSHGRTEERTNEPKKEGKKAARQAGRNERTNERKTNFNELCASNLFFEQCGEA